MNTMHQEGYEARVAYDEGADLFHGEVINLRDVITFQGESVAELKQAFNRSKTIWPSAGSGGRNRNGPTPGSSWCG